MTTEKEFYLQSVMEQMTEFVEENYKREISPLILAEYKSLFMEYVKFYSEVEKEGGDIPVFEYTSEASDEEYDSMMNWMEKVTAMTENTMTEEELGGDITLN